MAKERGGCADELTMSIDGGAQTRMPRHGLATPALPEGAHEIRLWGHDQAGNTQPTPTRVALRIDQTPPPEPTLTLTTDTEELTAVIAAAEGAVGTWQLEVQHEAATARSCSF